MPKVSVIMPVLNGAKYLSDAVESVLGQTMPDWELLLADGGSCDASPDIIREYSRRDSRVRAVRRPSSDSLRTHNAAENRNRALAHASGEYAAMLDADDIAHPDRLSQQTDFLDLHPELTAVGCNFDFIDADGGKVERAKYAKRLTDPDELRRHTALGWHCFLQSSMLFRRAALAEIGGYRALFRYAEEDDLYYRLYDRGRVLANLPDVLVDYRWHGENSCNPSLATQLHRAVALGCAHCRRNGLPDPATNRVEAPDYPFLLDIFDRLGDKGLPVRFFWIGVLQHYDVADESIFLAAWLETLGLRVGEFVSEAARHWENCRKKYPRAAATIRGRLRNHATGTVAAALADMG